MVYPRKCGSKLYSFRGKSIFLSKETGTNLDKEVERMIFEGGEFVTELRQNGHVHLHILLCLINSYLSCKSHTSSLALRRAFPVLHIPQILTSGCHHSNYDRMHPFLLWLILSSYNSHTIKFKLLRCGIQCSRYIYKLCNPLQVWNISTPQRKPHTP